MCPQRHSAKCQQAHKNSLRLKLQSSSLFAQAVPRARWNPDHSWNHNLVQWGCLSSFIWTWSLFWLSPTTDSSILLSSLMIRLCTCGQPTSEISQMYKKPSRTLRQWLESNMVPPSKDGNQSRGGVYQLWSYGYPKGFRYCDWTICTSSTSTKWKGQKSHSNYHWKSTVPTLHSMPAAIMVGILC